MKRVLKSTEPPELEKYKQRYSSQFRKWKDLKKNTETYNAVRNTLVKDQKGLCAYCEITLNEKNRSVEHFIPCNQSTKENNYDLDWSNMLAICCPPGGLTENDLKNLGLPHNFPCCGKSKNDFVSDGRLLNPLELSNLCLFRFNNEDGEIKPDETVCKQVGIPIENAHFTIETLGLNVQRLKDKRLVLIEEITEELDELDDGIIDPIDLDKKIAEMYFGDGTKNWPRFFTTIRWMLKEGAEQHLKEISYSG
jgi:uncharacterized protein (TIGR02646 family)